jgi:hypothetical protein
MIKNRLIYLTIIIILLGLITEVSAGYWGFAPSRSFKINSNPEGVNIIFDGMYAGKTPAEIPLTDTKIHSIRLSLEGYKSWEGTVSSLSSGSSWGIDDINVNLEKM